MAFNEQKKQQQSEGDLQDILQVNFSFAQVILDIWKAKPIQYSSCLLASPFSFVSSLMG